MINKSIRKRKQKTFYVDVKNIIPYNDLKHMVLDLIINNEEIGRRYNIKGKFIARLIREYGIDKSKAKRTCCICGGTYKPYPISGSMYCYKHYQQIKQYGKIFEITKYDLNEIVILEDRAEIVLHSVNHNESGRAIIDLDDVEKVRDKKWYLSKTGYVCSKRKMGTLRLHVHVFNKSNNKHYKIDHINRNKLDCRKENLRLANNTQNAINKSLMSNNTSGYTGVSYNKSKKRWESYIRVNKKKIRLGYHKDIKDAIIARLMAEKKYFGYFAPQQHLFEEYNI